MKSLETEIHPFILHVIINLQPAKQYFNAYAKNSKTKISLHIRAVLSELADISKHFYRFSMFQRLCVRKARVLVSLSGCKSRFKPAQNSQMRYGTFSGVILKVLIEWV